MNGKQAKRLRRAALGLAVALNEAGRDIKKDGYQIRKHENAFNPAHGEDGKPIPSYQLLVRPDSMKGIYKKLKTGKV
jgi:hypothetical protein